MSDCIARECVKKGRKGVWEESFSSSTCCSFMREGFTVGEEIRTITAEDGCTKVTLVCSEVKGSPDVDVRVVNECGGGGDGVATEETMIAGFERVTSMLQSILNETGNY